jgi:hypothetical protein
MRNKPALSLTRQCSVRHTALQVVTTYGPDTGLLANQCATQRRHCQRQAWQVGNDTNNTILSLTQQPNTSSIADTTRRNEGTANNKHGKLATTPTTPFSRSPSSPTPAASPTPPECSLSPLMEAACPGPHLPCKVPHFC